MDGPPESNEARGKGLARYYGRFIPNLPLRGKLGWMTPRSRCENDAGYETRLPGPPIPSGGPFFFVSFFLRKPQALKSPHHPRLQQAKIIKPNHLPLGHVRDFVSKLHMQKRPQRRGLHLDDLPFDLPPRHQSHFHDGTDRIRSNSSRLKIRIFVADLALLQCNRV